jgi:predicted porin
MGGVHRQQATAAAGSRSFNAVGASYDFGIMHVGVSHTAGDVNNDTGKKNKVTQASVAVPVTPTVNLYALYSVTENGAYTTANQGKGYTLGASKHLSKRTSLYAAYSAIDNQANSRMVFSRQGETPTTGGLNTSALTAGISHRF